MKNKIIIFIILCLIFAVGASAESPEYLQEDLTEDTTEESEEENIAAQNFANTAVLLLIMIGLMSAMMMITKINKKNLSRM